MTFDHVIPSLDFAILLLPQANHLFTELFHLIELTRLSEVTPVIVQGDHVIPSFEYTK